MNADRRWVLNLESPADSRFLHVIRLTTAGTAAEAGLTTEEIDDVKIAIDELCSLMIAAGVEQLQLGFVVDENSLTIEAAGPADLSLELDDLTTAILDATLDKLELDDPTLGAGFRLTKNRSGG